MKQIKIFLFLILIIFSGCSLTSTKENKPYICITFDDQHGSIFSEAFPLMQQYGFKGTLFTNTTAINTGNLLTWEQIETMVFDEDWEIGGHCLHHVNLPELNYEEAYDEIYLDWLNLVERGLPHNSFALPSGHATEEQFGIIMEFYDNIRTSMNIRHYAPLNREYLGYLPQQTQYDSSVLIGRIIEAYENKEDLVVLGFHSFDLADGDLISYCEPEVFEEILQFISENNFEVLTLQLACDLLSK